MIQETFGYISASTAVFGSCFFVAGFLLWRHLFLLWKEEDESTRKNAADDDTWLHSKIIDYCTSISVFSFWTLTALLFASRLFMFTRATHLFPCSSVPLLYLEAWTTAKCTMYAVFAARLNISFHDSAYAYSKCTIQVMYSTILVAFVVFSATIPFTGDAHWEKTDYAANGRRVHETGGKRSMQTCMVQMNKALLGSMVVFDVIFSAVVVFLFARPLNALSKRRRRVSSTITRDSNHSEFDAEFELLPLKYTLLTAVAIVTTLTSVAVGATGVGILMPIDCIVNVGCLLLMTAHWKLCYWRLCGPLLRCLSKAHCIADYNKANIVAMTAIQHKITATDNS